MYNTLYSAQRKSMQCPLCESHTDEILQIIPRKNLIRLYQRGFGIDVGNLLPSDIQYHHCKECDFRFFTDKEGNAPTGDNDFCNALNKLEWYYMAQKNEYHYAKKFISPNQRVLEVGCGKAAFAKFLPTKNYVGLEFSSDAKKLAKIQGIEIQNISIQDYAKAHLESFDVVCSFQVLEHVSVPREFLESKLKALRGGGNDCRSA